jgi:hypothetical protein
LESTTLNGMPYGKAPDGPKSGWRSREGPPMFPIQVALLGWTGRLETSMFQTLLAGKTGQPPTLGAASAVAARAISNVNTMAIPRTLNRRARRARPMAAIWLSLEDGSGADAP